MEEALQRISDSEDRINCVAIQLKELKQEARDSEDFTQEMGFKVFPEVTSNSLTSNQKHRGPAVPNGAPAFTIAV